MLFFLFHLWSSASIDMQSHHKNRNLLITKNNHKLTMVFFQLSLSIVTYHFEQIDSIKSSAFSITMGSMALTSTASTESSDFCDYDNTSPDNLYYAPAYSLLSLMFCLNGLIYLYFAKSTEVTNVSFSLARRSYSVFKAF